MAEERFSISVEINTPVDRVFEVMSDTARWHEWTPSVTSIKLLDAGNFRIGTRGITSPDTEHWLVEATAAARLGSWKDGLCDSVSRGDVMLRAEERPMFEPTRPRIIAVALVAAAAASAALFAQQQAAEAPASTRPFYSRPAVAALNGVVTSGHPIASSAGLQILLKGGNAFDAAVAVGTMAALGEPEMNGIGGNGFMTIFDKKNGKVHSVSMAGAAPKALKPAEMTPETLNA